MAVDFSLWGLFSQASLVVKLVMVGLLAVSVLSWSIIIQRQRVIAGAKRAMREFEDKFWSGGNINDLYKHAQKRQAELMGLEHIFQAGYREFVRMGRCPGAEPQAMLEAAQRAMRVAYSREADELELHLPFLATVASATPYIGLFGTVWGIMNAFIALGEVRQATLNMVAPGIAEALIATAMGLFAAIPAVIAYNRYATQVERLLVQYDNFIEEFSSILHRQAHASSVE